MSFIKLNRHKRTTIQKHIEFEWNSNDDGKIVNCIASPITSNIQWGNRKYEYMDIFGFETISPYYIESVKRAYKKTFLMLEVY